MRESNPAAPEDRSLALVGRVAALACEAGAVDPALGAALGEICAFAGWPVGHVLLVRPGGVVGTTIWHGVDEPRLDAFQRVGSGLRLALGEGLPGEALSTGEPSWVADAQRDDRFIRREQAAEAGIRSALAFPLVGSREVVGVLELFGHEPREPDGALLSVLGILGPELGRMVERGQATERLRASEERYRLLFEGATDAILVGNVDGILTAVNPAACRLLGYSEHELLGRDGRSLCAPEWLDVAEHQAARKLDGREETSDYELVLVDRAGMRVPVEVRSSVLRSGDDVVGVHAVVRDVRERKGAEVALRESEERFRGAFDAAPVGMALCSTGGRWLKVNASLCRIVGYDEDELLQLRFQDLSHPDDLEENLALARRLLAGEIPSFQMDKRYLRKDGRVVWVRLSVSLVRAEDGSPAYTVAQVLELPVPPASARFSAGASPLSPRERQVLSHLAGGRTSAEAASALGIGGETVQTHVRRAMAKLSARTRTEAVATALRFGWLEPDGPATAAA